MPRAKQRTPQLRQEILAAAIDVLADGGPGGLTTRTVAGRADTSVPALYELFGDKSGLVRALFYEGFRRLEVHYGTLTSTGDPIGDLREVLGAFRAFATENPHLFGIMYARPFAEFDPGPDETATGAATRGALVGAVERCVEAGAIVGDSVDIAHGLLALASGLATQEIAGWLGSSPESAERRWLASVETFLRGTQPR